MKRHIIYIPGLGDGLDVVRRAGLFFWRRPGVAVSLVPMRWSDPDETYTQKLDRIEDMIDAYPGHETVLVGESAGGATALVVMHRYRAKVDRVVTICGMNQGADNVRAHLYRKNRAFRGIMDAADKALPTLTDTDKKVIKTLYSSNDRTVGPKDTLIGSVAAYDLKLPGHQLAIVSVLFFRHGLILKPRQ